LARKRVPTELSCLIFPFYGENDARPSSKIWSKYLNLGKENKYEKPEKPIVQQPYKKPFELGLLEKLKYL